MMRLPLMLAATLLFGNASLLAEEKPEPAKRASLDRDAAARGREALLGRSFTPAFLSFKGYENAWRHWGKLTEKPKDYDRLFRERYGLHAAPYPNGKYPMGLRTSRSFLIGKGLSTDCMTCHGGSIFGKSYVGLGNTTLDFQAMVEEMALAEGRKPSSPFQSCQVRGTVEAGAMGVFLLGYRNPDMTVRLSRIELGLHDDLCEDVPAWWLLKKKKTMYHTGGGDARSVRSLMQFMMSPFNGPDVFEKEEATFRDIRAYLLSLDPPKYPLPINDKLAQRGEAIFNKTCARCHGTYGKDWTYPNRIVPLDEIGTDATRFHGIPPTFTKYYNKSWFAKEKPGWFVDGYPGNVTRGYQAPPLDGVWATAPYFHNGAVPTIYNVLKSDSRPKIFTRSYRTGKEDYDFEKVGWKVQVLKSGPAKDLPAIERRKVYDTTQRGRGNQGHTFGDRLKDDERRAVIEYLKSL